MEKSRYEEAGVSIDRANAFVKAIGPIIKKTFSPSVISDFGGFSSLYSLDTTRYKDPVLVSSTDGVGTKLLVARMMEKYDTVGIDLVAMCVNDILVTGAKPVFFLDYMAFGKLDLHVATELIKGIARGCTLAECALIGGETAELPGLYKEGDFDLAGFAVGIVERDRIIDGSDISNGDKILGISSSGLHSNGYSLVRKIFFEELGQDVNSYIEDLGRTLGEELLEPTRIYVHQMLSLIKGFNIHGIAHITGGGFVDNIPRILPKGLKAVIHTGSWEIPPIFQIIQERGRVSREEMFKTFNNGIGMVVVVGEEDLSEALERLKGLGEKVSVIGEIELRREGEPSIIIN